jgi:inosine-uridine nucleoside N-ribohydrolase
MDHALLLDCDPGHDDVMAIVLAAHVGTLLGVTTCHGNAPLERTTANALLTMQVYGLDVPVCAGAERPLIEEPRFAPHIHGASGLAGPVLPDLTRVADPRHAVEFIVETVRAAEGEGIWLVPTGPLTNIALALRVAPDIGHRIAGISLMGGGTPFGNRTSHAEFNIWADPEAAAIVFGYGGPLKMVGLNVTFQVNVTESHVARVRELGTPQAAFTADLLHHFASAYGTLRGHYGGPLHDPCAVLAVTHPHLLGMEARHVAVELTGTHTRGMTAVDERPFVNKPGANAEVAYHPDVEAILDLVIDAVAATG